MSIKKKNALYVGGLDEAVTEEILHAAFIPFGDIASVQIVKDFAANKTRGFAFVEFELDEDAEAAIENMDGAELFSRVIRCNVAKSTNKVNAGKAVWSAEEWIQNSLNETQTDNIEEES